VRGKPSVPVRISHMEQQRQWVDLEAEIQALAAEYGLHPNEVRHELETVQDRIARYGPDPIKVTIRRCAEEFGIDETELRAEYEQIQARRAASCPA
jgi:hypothetical protein